MRRAALAVAIGLLVALVAPGAVLAADSPPVASLSFTPGGIQPGGVSTLIITLTNPNLDQATGVAINDLLPAGVVVATPNGLAETCGGTATATAGSGSISLAGGVIAASSSCSVDVDVTASSVGTYVDTSDPPSSTEGGTGGTASATLTVAEPPTISTLFVPDTTPAGGESEVSYTISNPNSDVALTGVSVTDVLPAGLTVASPSGASNTCGGALTAVPGSGTITLSGGTVGTAGDESGGECFVGVEAQASGTGSFDNTTGPISANESGPGASSNTATLTVTPAPVPPTLSAAFGAESVTSGGTTSLTFTVANPNASTDLLNVRFADPLPAGMVVASPSGVGGTCISSDRGAVSATAGASSVSLQELELPASATCSVALNVIASGSAVETDTTGAVQASYDDGSGTFVNLTGSAASAQLTVIGPPLGAEAFSPAVIAPRDSSALTITLTNPNATVALSGVGFADALPSGLTIASPNGLGGSCLSAGTASASPGSGSVTLSGAGLAAAASCTLVVDVTGGEGAYSNPTGPISSTEGGSGPGASAALSIAAPPVASLAFGSGSILTGGSTTLSLTLHNPNAVRTLSGLAVSDSLPTGLVVEDPAGLIGACGGTITAAAGSGVVALSGGGLAPGASCTVTVDVTGTSAGSKSDATGPVSSNEAPAGSSATAAVTVVVPPAQHLPPPPPSNLFTIAHVRGTARDGVVTFKLTIPGAGRISVLETGWDMLLAHSAAATGDLVPGGDRFAFARTTRGFAKAGTYTVAIEPGAAGKRAARRNGRGYRINLWVTYTPTGGTARTRSVIGLRLRP